MTDLALHLLRDALDSFAEKDGKKAVEVRNRDEEIDSMYTSLFRAAHLHDGGSRHGRLCHPSFVLRQEHRAHGRSRDQYCGSGLLHDRRSRVRQRTPEGGHDQRYDNRFTTSH